MAGKFRRLFLRLIDLRTLHSMPSISIRDRITGLLCVALISTKTNNLTLLLIANGSSNPSNTLNTFRGLASLAYGDDNRIVLTGQYFNTQGSSDTGLYANNPGCACSPNSNGYIAEIAYIPFISSQAPGWPWANMRVGLQYTYYNKFDGDTVFAHDNNTLFGYIWFAM